MKSVSFEHDDSDVGGGQVSSRDSNLHPSTSSIEPRLTIDCYRYLTYSGPLSSYNLLTVNQIAFVHNHIT